MTIRFIDLFAGIGGFRLALDSFGFDCVFSSEIDVDCQSVYEHNFGECPSGDITKILAQDIPEHDILCGGFPCQSFSIAGKQAGFSDIRGTLFYDIVRIVRAKHPKILFLENVRNLVSHDSGQTLAIIKQTLEALGYNVFYSIMNAGNYGIPIQRLRVYILAFDHNLGIKIFDFPRPTPSQSNLFSILEPQVSPEFEVNREDVVWTTTGRVEPVYKPIRLGHIGLGRQGERIYSPLGHAITFSSSGGGPGGTSGLYYIDNKIRRLTPRECFLAMGFPSSFKIAPHVRTAYTQIGNSVAVPVIKQIIQQLMQILAERRLHDIRTAGGPKRPRRGESNSSEIQ